MILGEKIGEGNTAEVYEYDTHNVLKLFHPHVNQSYIDTEFTHSKKIYKLGLPTPKVKEIVSFNEKVGIIYDKITGKNLMEYLVQCPKAVSQLAIMFAELHFHIHQFTTTQFSEIKSILKRNIEPNNILTNEQKDVIYKYLETLPNRQNICHMDFHPENIILSHKRPTVIDWMTVSSGDPYADVARTVMIFRHAVISNVPFFLNEKIHSIRHTFCDKYIAHYLHLAKGKWKDIHQWMLPIMAARLVEGIPDKEKDILYEQIIKLL